MKAAGFHGMLAVSRCLTGAGCKKCWIPKGHALEMLRENETRYSVSILSLLFAIEFIVGSYFSSRVFFRQPGYPQSADAA